MDITLTSNVPVTMRDGTVLRADLYRPDDDGRYPVLLRRTPYRKEGWAPFARRMAEAGYTVVVQDLRGRGASDGEFIWSFAEEAQEIEALDGYDTVEWCGAHQHSDGNVGTWGHSYDGWSQLRTSIIQPPSLKAMHVAGITARYLEMARGILDIGRRMEWCYTMGADLAARGQGSQIRVDEDLPVDRNPGLVQRWEDERSKWLWFVPLADLPDHALTGASKLFQDYISRINRETWNFDRDLARIQVPTAILTGWWDRFSDAVRLYQGLVDAAPAGLAARHRLLVGPWSHNPDTFVADLGDLDTGGKGGLDYCAEVIAWFDTQLKGASPSPDPVRYFTVGANEWRAATVWPPANVTEASYFLHSDGNAARPGAGSLDREHPGIEVPDVYDYDPRDPVMSLMLGDSHHAPKDQSANDARPDVLHYSTAPLEEAVEVTGTPRMRLWASTDGPDTDWVVRLVDVDPEGRALNVSGGIMRARYRHSYDEPELLTPDEPTEFLIDLSATSYVFLPGHRLRVDVTSSDFPNFDRNHNTGADFATDPELRVARQSILHTEGHASELLLPVAGGAA